MVDYIKPQALPAAASVTNGASIPLGSGLTDVVKATPKQIVDAGRPVATEAQAVAGTMNDVTMTPLTVKQAVEANGNAWGMRARAWAESDTPPDPTDPTSKSAKTWAGESASSAADARADAETLNNAVVMKTWVLRSEADGQRVFTQDADGNPIETVGQGNRLEGPAPLGFLTPNVDYTAENDEVVLNFDSTAGDLFLFTTMPRVTSTEAQAYLNELRDETGANAAAAEAAADRAEVFGPRQIKGLFDFEANTSLTPSNTPPGTPVVIDDSGAFEAVSSGGEVENASGLNLNVLPSGGRYVIPSTLMSNSAAFLRSLRRACANPNIREVVIPSGIVELTGTASKTIDCYGDKHIISAGSTKITLSHNSPALVFFNRGDASIPATCKVEGFQLERSWAGGAPIFGGWTFCLHSWTIAGMWIDCHERGANSFGLTIHTTKTAFFDRCSATSHFGGVSGDNGTDGMHSISCESAVFSDCYVDGVGDDALSTGREVRSNTDSTERYPFVVSAHYIRCRTGVDIKGAGIKVYGRVKDTYVTDCHGITGRAGGVSFDPGSPAITDAGVNLYFDNAYISNSTFRDCRGNAVGRYPAISTILHDGMTARNPIHMGSLIVSDCVFDGCFSCASVGCWSSSSVKDCVVKRQERRYGSGGADEEVGIFSARLSTPDGSPVTVDISSIDVLDGLPRRAFITVSDGLVTGLPSCVNIDNISYQNAALGVTNLLTINAPAWYNVTNVKLRNLTAAAFAWSGPSPVHPRSVIERPATDAKGPTGYTQSGPTPVYWQGPQYVLTSAPSSGSHFAGTTYYASNRSTGQPTGWMCSTKGTFGSLSGVTASGSAGSPIIAVSDTSSLYRGQTVIIDGVSGRYEIIRKELDGYVEVSPALASTATTAVVSFAPPSFVALPSFSAA